MEFTLSIFVDSYSITFLKNKLVFIFIFCSSTCIGQLNNGFVYLKDHIPFLQVELRYATAENFMGRPVDGYSSAHSAGTYALAIALQRAQKKLNALGYQLKIFDAYRPQRAVDDFVRWAKLPQDTLKKRRYYPEIDKKHLFAKGYIAQRSGHSRGSTVDLTITHLHGQSSGQEVDMGGSWDFFGERSHYGFSELTPDQKENRKRLREVMISVGFIPYEKEWWHFTLKNEPYPDTYFDFVLK